MKDCNFEAILSHGARWHMPVIVATWEVEIGRIVVRGQPGQKFEGLQLNQQVLRGGGCLSPWLNMNWRISVQAGP
jgi:hypothetical protein